MIKLPQLSSTHNVVTETAYDILSSNIDNLYTTLGTVTDYVSAAQQQGEIAAISAANVAVSSMGVVGSHLDTILSTENTIKEISSDLANSLDIVSEADNRFTKLELVYEPSGVNCIRGFENLTFDKIISYPESATDPSPITAFEDGNYYKGGYFRFVSGKYNIISSLSINNFNNTDDIAPVDLASTYITIDNTTTNITMYMGQTGCPVDANANGQMVLSLYVKGTGNLILNLGSGDTTKAINTDTWQRISVYRGGLANSKYITGTVNFSVKPNSTISICAPQFEKGTSPTVYNPNCSYKLIKPNTINVDTVNAIDIYSTNSSTNLLTYNNIVQKINASDTSDYPMAWVETVQCKSIGKCASINGDTNFTYQCDQWYHYFVSQNYTYVYDLNCKFVVRINGGNWLYYHDTTDLQALCAANDTKVLIASQPTWGQYKTSWRIYDFTTGNLEIAFDNICIGGVTGNPDCYAITQGEGGNVTVNDITGHFIIFCMLYHHTEVTADDGTVTKTNTKIGNGYLVLTNEGEFIKYNPETDSYITSTVISPEVFHIMENTPVSSPFGLWLGNPIAFRNTIRGTITNKELQTATWVTCRTTSAELDGIFVFDKHDTLIPVRGPTNTTGNSGFDANGVVNMSNSQYVTKITTPFTKNVYAYNRAYAMVAGSQSDTINSTTALVCDVIHGNKVYQLYKNTETGECSIRVQSANGVWSCHQAFNDTTVWLDGKVLIGADGGSYGGRGIWCYSNNSSYIIPSTIPTIKIPVKFSGSSCVTTYAIGLRSTRLQTAYPSNFNNAGCYAATWRGGFHMDI